MDGVKSKYAPECEGKSGWLSPEGRFYYCRYGEHWIKARKILKKFGVDTLLSEDKLKHTFQWVSMGSSYGSSYVSIAVDENGPRPYTEKQIAWLKKNYADLDKAQQEYLDLYGPLSGWVSMS